MSKQSFNDSVLGEIIVQRNVRSSGIRIKTSLTGQLVVIASPLLPMSLIKLTVRKARDQLQHIQNSNQAPLYRSGQSIGKSHTLKIVTDDSIDDIVITVRQRQILCRVPADLNINSKPVQQTIKEHVIKILRKEAKAYLTRRLAVLAKRHNYSYNKVRFPHAASRWGSCSSNGTISLNIALMKLELEEIDYVLIHELCHTIEMNHSTRFWNLVAAAEPNYKVYRQAIKKHTPAL